MSQSNKPTVNPELWDFPCKAMVKTMGFSGKSLDQTFVAIAEQLSIKADESTLAVKQSRTGKYDAVTLQFHFENKDQVQALYKALHEHPDVVWSL